MNNLWQFQSQNELKVQQLLDEMAKNPKLDNKWNVFVSKSVNCTSNNISSMDYAEQCRDEREISAEITLEDSFQELIQEEELKCLRELFENDVKTNIISIAKICTKKVAFWEYLADNFCEQNIEIFIKCFPYESSLSKDTINSFYKNFFARLLGRKYSRIMLEAILEIYRNNLSDFSNYLLPVIYNEKDIPPDVLLDFSKSLSDIDKAKILEVIINLKHNIEIFSKHLLSIIILYKTCEKSNAIQNYILTVLLTYSEMFTDDKNYGKLLLIYIQNLKHYPKNYSEIEKIILEHNSILKRPCLIALLNLKKIDL